MVEERDCQVVLLGTRSEQDSCAYIADHFPEHTLNLAGRTSLEELAATLGACTLAIANDSGGMHLAAAVGTPVVGIYGITDPEKTGPLGPANRTIFDPNVVRSRDLARQSALANATLSAIHPERVLQAVHDILNAVTPP